MPCLPPIYGLSSYTKLRDKRLSLQQKTQLLFVRKLVEQRENSKHFQYDIIQTHTQYYNKTAIVKNREKIQTVNK